jgi:hypothetical protein
MGTGLTIITPGGVAMATEEVFDLIATCRRASAQLAQSTGRLQGLGHPLSRVHRATSAVAGAQRRCEELVLALTQLTENAAVQEGWRQARLGSIADRLLHTVVAGVAWSRSGRGEGWVSSITGEAPSAPRSTLTGREAEAWRDDTAAILRGEADLSSTPVVRPVEREGAVRPAVSMAERIARIPPPDSPIRVETYRLGDGSTHAEVFIAGTAQWGVGTGESAFDLGSNLGLVAGVSAASVIATTQAMRQAGVKPGDSVSFVGHSQGGAVALTVAESGVYATRSVVTVGSPTGTLPVRGNYPAVVIEHSNDSVPGLGGARLATQATVVQRDSGHRVIDIHGAHAVESYRETAAMIDRSPVPWLAGILGNRRNGEVGRATVFSASQRPVPPPPG